MERNVEAIDAWYGSSALYISSPSGQGLVIGWECIGWPVAEVSEWQGDSEDGIGR
jgi:hypothetical protein